MSRRERILAAVRHQPVDRIPSDIWATEEVWVALAAHFGTDDRLALRDHLGLDGILEFGPAYTGPDRTLPDGTTTGPWGARYTTIELDTGGTYSEQCYYPLQEVTDPAQLDDFNWENPADYDFAGVAAQCRRCHGEYFVMAGYLAPFVDLWTLFGVETALLNLALRPALIEAVLERTMTYRLEQHRRLFEATAGSLDACQVTDDFGSQQGLVMSRETIRRFFWPWYREAIALAKRYGLYVFHHDDGGIYQILPDLCELGVDLLNPIQWRCAGMDRERLKAEFGDRLCFHGAVDTQEIMAFGSMQDVRAEVRENLRTLAADGTGFIIAPCHNIQSGTPLDNVLALYDEIALRAGDYAGGG